MVVDTSIWVDLLRGSKQAAQFLLRTEPLLMSRVTLLELVHGLPSRTQISILKKQLGALRVTVVEINERISELAGSTYERFYHSHGIGIIDAFIAATTIEMGGALVTHNTKHFHFIPDLTTTSPY